jgi:hypothetical protein
MSRVGDAVHMTKRVLAGVLWFFAVAYSWNLVAMLVGFSESPGYVLGLFAGILFAVDPARRVWRHDGTIANGVSASSTS